MAIFLQSAATASETAEAGTTRTVPALPAGFTVFVRRTRTVREPRTVRLRAWPVPALPRTRRVTEDTLLVRRRAWLDEFFTRDNLDPRAARKGKNPCVRQLMAIR